MQICGNGKIKEERTCVKRGRECTGNGLEEMVGKVEKQSKMEEVMLVALAGWVVFCVLWVFCLGFFKADHTAVANFFLSL